MRGAAAVIMSDFWPSTPQVEGQSSSRHHEAFLGRVKVDRRTDFDILEQINYMRHHHSDAARACPPANAFWIRGAMNAEICVPVADIQIDGS